MNKKIIDKNLLTSSYVEDEKSITQLAKELEICRATIKKNLQNYGIKIRSDKLQQILDLKNSRTRRKKDFDKEFLLREYIQNEKSISFLARELCIRDITLRRILIEKGIKIRSYIEQQVLDYKNKRRSNLNLITEGVEKNPEFFYILGVFKGDGHINEKRNVVQVNVSIKNVEMLEEVVNIMKKLSPKTRIKIIRHHDGYKNTTAQKRINFYSKDFFDKNLHKLLPKTIEEKRYYLRGLFDAEGSLYLNLKKLKKISKENREYYGWEKCLSIAQKNIVDLTLWNSWLSELGVEFKTHLSKNTRSQLVTKKNKSIILFNKLIGFKIKRKQQNLEKAISLMTKSKLDQVKKTKVKNLYEETRLGALLIGKIFDRSKGSVLGALNNMGVDTSIRKRLSKYITIEDIKRAEEIYGAPLNLLYNSVKHEKGIVDA